MYPSPGTHHTVSHEHKYKNLQFQIIAYLVLFHKQKQRAIHFHHYQEPSKNLPALLFLHEEAHMTIRLDHNLSESGLEFCFLGNNWLFTTLFLQDHLPSSFRKRTVCLPWSEGKPLTAACRSFYPNSQVAIRTVCYSDSLKGIANNEAEEAGEPAKELAHLKGTIATQQQILG